jgi:hypothetical protein
MNKYKVKVECRNGNLEFECFHKSTQELLQDMPFVLEDVADANKEVSQGLGENWIDDYDSINIQLLGRTREVPNISDQQE